MTRTPADLPDITADELALDLGMLQPDDVMCGAEMRPWLRRDAPILCNERAGQVDPYDKDGWHRSTDRSSGGSITWQMWHSFLVPLDGVMCEQPAELVSDGRCAALCCRKKVA